MRSEDYAILDELLKEFRKEAAEIDVQTSENLRRVREAETYISSVTDSESDDFKVFSPRKAEVLYKKELEDARREIAVCRDENGRLCRRRELLAGYVEKLEALTECLKRESGAGVKEAGELRDESLRQLENLGEKLDSVCSYIDKKPVQAKQDLAIAGKCLKEVMDKMRDTMWDTMWLLRE